MIAVMQIVKSLVLAAAILALGIPAVAQKDQEAPKGISSGMLYGPNFAYLLSPPKDWIMDNESGRGNGLHAVFYPKGSSWAKGSVVMYTNVLIKKGKQTMDELIAQDIAGFRANSPNLKVENGKPMILDEGRQATIKYFSNDANGNFEALAYIDESTCVVLIVLNSRTQKEFDSSLSAFEELTRSYSFVTDKVTIQK